MPSTLDWLRGRTDAQLADLLDARPDLLLPAPGDLVSLARRLDSPHTARRAVGRLDAFALQVLNGLLLLDAVRHPQPAAAVADLLGGPAGVDDVAAELGRLETAAFVRADADGFRALPATRDALGPYPGGLGAPTGLSDEQVAAGLAVTDEAGLALLRRLVPGPPIGLVEAGSPHEQVLTALVARGLLRRDDERTVRLPREVALALRGDHPFGPALPAPPALRTWVHGVATVDGAAAGQALAAHARAVHLLEKFGLDPVPALKSGGVGIVALRRLARDLDLDEHLAALHVELLSAAGLIAPVIPRSGATGHWMPTQAADTFLAGTEAAGWAVLATAWLNLPRDPARIGARDPNGKLCNALAVELDWRGGPGERRRVLADLAGLDPGTGAPAADVAARAVFRAPRADPAALTDRATAVLVEATELGVIAFDALSGPGRAVLDDDVEGAAEAMEEALPEAGSTVLVQADMTVVAPGRLVPELSAALSRAADVESAGGATVYRISEASLRRALDAGATATELHDLFEKHSATPVPQSIGYLIDDVARRHGVLRAGAAGAYLRSEDPTLIGQAIAAASAAGIVLRALAPTVAVSSAELPALVEVLRAAGLAPAAEDASGSVLDLRPRPRRTRITIPARPQFAEPAAASAEQIAAIVRRMRAGDVDLGASQDPRDVLVVLREAARAHTAVWITYADAEGGASRRIVEPVVVSGGSLLAYDRLRRTPRTFPVHRISSAHPE